MQTEATRRAIQDAKADAVRRSDAVQQYVTALPQIHVVDRDHREWCLVMAAETRAALLAFRRFGRVIGERLKIAQCLDLWPEYAYWFAGAGERGELSVLLHSTCDVCGTALIHDDVLGREQYAVGPFAQACADCLPLLGAAYAETVAEQAHPDVFKTMARLRAFALQRPDTLAAIVVAAMQVRGWTVLDLQRELQLDALRVLQLVIVDAAMLDDHARGISAIAAALPCRVEPLQSFINDGLMHTRG